MRSSVGPRPPEGAVPMSSEGRAPRGQVRARQVVQHSRPRGISTASWLPTLGLADCLARSAVTSVAFEPAC